MIVHHKQSEEKLVREGFGLWRKEFMYNDYVLIGPKSDPGNIKGSKSIIEALESISENKLNFISRGDDSGTHKKESFCGCPMELNPILKIISGIYL